MKGSAYRVKNKRKITSLESIHKFGPKPSIAFTLSGPQKFTD
jgi:hypothetical protein